ncbi:hypothetical protein C7B77_25590 [Chamaesiphon polymorphus CCALA 037]|uniref:Uncharacterized protein n=1 Tax=Chamaesiphon polymorphus CCALA 037 TaxID=2107692 RepID=A0A2T1FHW0_9CYAN|nr:hypothetical protein C7B77_25590 [Chamaesiphon polymorphus CCALA 037]
MLDIFNYSNWRIIMVENYNNFMCLKMIIAGNTVDCRSIAYTISWIQNPDFLKKSGFYTSHLKSAVCDYRQQ